MTALSFLIPTLALAIFSNLHLPEPGRFSYGGEFEVVQKQMVEGVHINTKEGLARAEQLRKQGYACTFASNNLARCIGFVSVSGAEAEVKSRVDSRMNGMALEFGPLAGEPSLQLRGETYEEWSVPQAGSFAGKAFGGYRYQILKDGPHKMLFGEDGVVVSDTGLYYVVKIQKQLKRFLMASYMVHVKLR